MQAKVDRHTLDVMASTANGNEPVVALRGSALRSLGIDERAVACLTRELIRELFEDDLPLVQRVVVADYELYGDAIRAELDHDPGQTHTDREHYKGLAITIPKGTQKDLTHTVIVCAGAVAAALGHEGVEPTMPCFLGRYLLQHEFAHCHDHRVRGSPACGADGPADSWLQEVNARFQRTLLAEFAACWISGTALTDEAFEFLSRLDADPLEVEIQLILRFREEYRIRLRNDLSEIAGEACQCIWMILIQYAKLFGHMVGATKSSASIATPGALASRPEAMTAINDLSRLLSTRTSDYPEWPNDGWDELRVIWNRLALSLGFRFEETPLGPALWFD